MLHIIAAAAWTILKWKSTQFASFSPDVTSRKCIFLLAATVKRRNVNKGRHKRNTRHACNMHFNFITKVTAHRWTDERKKREREWEKGIRGRTAFTDTQPGDAWGMQRGANLHLHWLNDFRKQQQQQQWKVESWMWKVESGHGCWLISSACASVCVCGVCVLLDASSRA